MRRTFFFRWLLGLALGIALSRANAVLGEPPSDLRQRLRDPSPTIRKQAALTLAETNEAAAIPVLIDLLAELPASECAQIEETLSALAEEWTPQLQLALDDPISRGIRRDAWAAWWRRTDGPALLAVLAQHTLTPEKRRKVEELVTQLGSDDFKLREDASEQLLAFGRLILPRLREAVKDRDAEVSRRTKSLIQRIEKRPDRRLPLAALRLLALRKPEGAAAALLAYVPFAEDEMCEEEVRKALVVLAARNGKPDAALRRALADAQPKVRALAAEGLIEGGGDEGRAAVRELLAKDTPSVRLRAALALARSGRREGIAILVDLLNLLPVRESRQAEDALYQVAGESAPNLPEDAKLRHAVWAAWWKANAERVDPSRLSRDTLLGYTIICDNFGGRVFEVDRHGKERWSIGGLRIPLDAVVLPGRSVLIAEYQSNRVTERDFHGTILWQKDIQRPVNIQRLPNGHTFIATHGGPMVELDRTKKEIYSIPNLPGHVLAAYRCPQGDIACLTADGQCHLLDINGKELKAFAAGHDKQSTCGIDLRPNGHILITRNHTDKVVEFDREGRLVRELDAAGVGIASQAPHGNFLIADYKGKRVYEMDRGGKIVWEYKGSGHLIRARRR